MTFGTFGVEKRRAVISTERKLEASADFSVIDFRKHR